MKKDIYKYFFFSLLYFIFYIFHTQITFKLYSVSFLNFVLITKYISPIS